MLNLFKALLPLLGHRHSSRFLNVGVLQDDFALALAQQALAIWVVGVALALVHSGSC